MVLLTRDLLPILMFGVVMPALDQFSDVAFALRLMGGPANDTILLTGTTSLKSESSLKSPTNLLKNHFSEPSWPVRHRVNTTFQNYPEDYKNIYREVR